MKYKLIALAVLLCLGINNIDANATRDGENKGDNSNFYIQNSFHPHWVIRVQAGLAETVGEADFTDLLSPAFATSIGYNFNQNFGVQVQFAGLKAKGGYPAINKTYEWDYVQGTIGATIDLDNIIWGFKHDRRWNPYAYAGVGLNMTSNNDEAEKLKSTRHESPYLWNENTTRFACQGGLGVDIRLSKRVAINLEANTSMLGDKANSKKGSNPDWQINAVAGLSFTLGKSYIQRKIYVEPEPTITPQELEPEKEPVVIEEDIVVEEPEQKDEVKEEYAISSKKQESVEAIENIFFDRNKSQARKSEIVKIDRLIAFMQENPETIITITGYADKKTGTKQYNFRLSQKRAEYVASVLKEAGINAERIVVIAKGDTEQPFEVNEDNRVSICIAANKGLDYGNRKQ